MLEVVDISGNPLENVVEADDVKGWIRQAVVLADGQLLLRNGEPVLTTAYPLGGITIRRKER